MARASLASWQPSDRSYRWEIADEIEDVPLTVAECSEDGGLAALREQLFSASPSLDEAPPFAVVLAHDVAGDSILLNLHHAAGDGVSAMRLMLSILRDYAGEEDPVPALDPLVGRDVLAFSRANSEEERIARERAVEEDADRRLTPAARIARDGGDGRPGYGFELLAFSREETQAICAKRTDGTTVNDVLLAALAVAIRRWNDDHGQGPGAIALTMPVNLRPAAWRQEVVANFASYVTVFLGVHDPEDLGRALEATGERTRQIKRSGVAGMVVDQLVGPSMLPVAAKRRLKDLIPMTGDVVVDTASLSNLGTLEAWPSIGGGRTVEAMWFSPPGRMPLGAAIGAATLGGRLHVTLRYPHAQFASASARAFAAGYRAALLG
jgi:NRPS condensation-like uncharacterized protein